MLNEVLRRDTLSQAGRARVAKKNTQSDAFWSLFGDAVFAVLVASSVAWGLASIGHYKGWWDIGPFLGENYDRDGFCLAHKGTWYESQLLSMYGSVVLAFVLQVMVRSLAGNRGELLVVPRQTAPRVRWEQGQVLRALRAHPVPLVRGHVGGAVLV